MHKITLYDLPNEILLKVLNYDVFELEYINRFFQVLVESNKNNICYNIIKNYNLTPSYEDSYIIYKFYKRYKYKFNYTGKRILYKAVEKNILYVLKFIFQNNYFYDKIRQQYHYFEYDDNDNLINVNNYIDDLTKYIYIDKLLAKSAKYGKLDIYKYINELDKGVA
jgi:hypothetical protein